MRTETTRDRRWALIISGNLVAKRLADTVFARKRKKTRRKNDVKHPVHRNYNRQVVGEINRERNYGANCRAASCAGREGEREREREGRGCKLIVDCPMKERNFIGDRVGQGERG